MERIKNFAKKIESIVNLDVVHSTYACMQKIANPVEFLREVRFQAIKSYLLISPPQSTLVADMVWDNLIVLDCCRFDAFARHNDIAGRLIRTVSTASCTWDWLGENFSHKDMKDVIYVSANPFASYYYLRRKLGYIPFYKIVEVWKNGWNDELKTVHPSAVNQATLDSLNSNPEKRHIIHYMQPHHPFIGAVKLVDTDAIPWRNKFLGRENMEERELDVFKMLQRGLVDAETIWKAYISNLMLVQGYVKKLLPSLTGKICITSDHGDSFGRYGVFYGHPSRVFLRELLEVPWLEVCAHG